MDEGSDHEELLFFYVFFMFFFLHRRRSFLGFSLLTFTTHTPTTLLFSIFQHLLMHCVLDVSNTLGLGDNTFYDSITSIVTWSVRRLVTYIN